MPSQLLCGSWNAWNWLIGNAIFHMFLGWDTPYQQVTNHSGFVCGDRFTKCPGSHTLCGLGYGVQSMCSGWWFLCSGWWWLCFWSPSGLGTAELRSTSPVVGIALGKGIHYTYYWQWLEGKPGYPTCEPLRIKGRLFHTVLAEGQLQLSVPATLPKKSFSKKAPQTNTFWFIFS